MGHGSHEAVSTVLTGLSFLFIGLVPVLWAGALRLAVSSLAVTTWNILIMSLRQSVIPGRLLGRVHGTWRTLLWGAMPLGFLIGGLASRIDLALPFIVFGALEVLASLVFFHFLMTLPNPEDVDNGDAAEPGPTDPLLGG